MGERVGELAGELREMRDGREKRKIEIEIEGDRVVGDGEGSTRLRKSSGVWYCSSRHFVRGSAGVRCINNKSGWLSLPRSRSLEIRGEWEDGKRLSVWVSRPIKGSNIDSNPTERSGSQAERRL